MLYQTNWLDIVYEAVFRTPMFTLARENVDVLRIFYHHLAPDYLVRSSDMQVSGGATLSDVKARITLFKGNGVLEVTLDKFSATFNNVVGEKDIETIKDCVTRSLSALAEWLPTMTYREHVIRSAAYLSLLSDSPTAADDFLNNLMGNKMAFRGETSARPRAISVLELNLRTQRTNGLSALMFPALGLLAICSL